MRTRFSSVLVAGTFAIVALAAMASADVMSANAVRLSPPVIHEPFSVLPCPGASQNGSTLADEGCAEHQILGTDKKIDALNRAIFAKLADDPARRRFITGHDAWLAYRHAYCLSVSDVFERGTEAALIDADCVAGVNLEHIKDLNEFLSDVSSN
jgi:uncharacterized protein YecT (DUF1311 family)